MFMRNTLLWKRSLGRMLSFFYFIPRTRKIILIYHAVGRGPWAISEDVFRKQIQWLKTNCDIVPLTQLLLDTSKKNKTQVSLTFDDGYACLYDTVLPILRAENTVGTIYINTGWMAECKALRKDSNPSLGHYPGEKFLIWDEVTELNKAGWEIGSHGVNHIDLTKQSADTIEGELHCSKMTIEKKLNRKCEHFAYTFGQHDAYVRNKVQKAGYQFAAAGHHKPLRKSEDFISFPRLNIQNDYSLCDFESIVLGKWDFLGLIHRIKRILQK